MAIKFFFSLKVKMVRLSIQIILNHILGTKYSLIQMISLLNYGKRFLITANTGNNQE